jgi:hypothetical protein
MLIRNCSIVFLLLSSYACRTSGDSEPEVKTPPPLALEITSSDPILQRVVGGLTKKYSENREETCTIVRGDIANLSEVDQAILNLSRQELAEGFIFRPQIPSIQYFAFIGKEAVLLAETGDEKVRYRRPEGEVGNPSLDILMNNFESKCGEKNATP